MHKKRPPCNAAPDQSIIGVPCLQIMSQIIVDPHFSRYEARIPAYAKKTRTRRFIDYIENTIFI